MELIARQTLGSAAASVTFSNIAATWRDLRLVTQALSARTSNNLDAICFRFNGDSATNYSATYLAGDGSAASSGRSSSIGFGVIGRINTSLSGNTTPSIGALDVMSYANASVYTTTLGETAANQEALSVARYVSLWRSTAAVTSITLLNAGGNDFASGSTFSLFGIGRVA